MARQKKPQIVDTISDERTKDSINLMMDRNTLRFFAEHQGERFEDGTAEPVRTWIREQLKANRKLIWTPVIRVSSDHHVEPMNRKQGATVGIEFDRFYLGVTPGGKIKRSQWEIRTRGISPRMFNPKTGQTEPDPDELLSDDELRNRSISSENYAYEIPIQDGRLVLPWIRPGQRRITYADVNRDQIVILPYTEETWIALERFLERLRVLAAQIDQLFGTPEGQERLVLAGSEILALALPAPILDVSEGGSDV